MSTAVKEDTMRGSKKRMMALMLTGILAVLMPAGCRNKEEDLSLEQIQVQSEEPERPAEESDSGGETEDEQIICVYVCGQVMRPGVYEFAAGSRIYQAVEAAGGMLETADEAFVNQAERMEDGQRVYIPSAEEVLSGECSGAENVAGDSGGGISSDGRVNINMASKEELMTLAGIGEKKAEAIIQYRDTNGGFQTTEELMQVAGIKEGTFEKIKEDITI
ncbi:MAG: helix-hairpin-helix domain-containing protein [Eubacteriales bacterium]|nr:helix-hairpin-helix domain-containing protein [Eubacteriales bacterium]